MTNIKLREFKYLGIFGISLAWLVNAPVYAKNKPPLPSDENSAILIENSDKSPIVVTGSLIPATDIGSTLAVETVSVETLRRTGLSTPLEFIKSLPESLGVYGDSNQFGSVAADFQGNGSINLRGLGSPRTLVLINGQRTITAPGDGFTDTGMIPYFALDRVEILKDGASTTYGSDAVAGVANFVTRSHWTGLELQAEHEFISDTAGDTKLSILGGNQFGRLNLVAGFGWQHRSKLEARDRDFASQPYATIGTNHSGLGNPGTYIARAGDSSLGADGAVLGAGVDGAQIGTCEASGQTLGSVCRFAYTPYLNLVEPTDSYQAFVQADVDLSETARFHAEALWARVDQERLAYSPSLPPLQGPNGPGFSNAFSVPSSNPGFAAFLSQTFAPGDPALAADYVTTAAWRPFGAGGNQGAQALPIGAAQGLSHNEGWRVSADLSVDLSSTLTLDTRGTYVRSFRRTYSRDFLGERLQLALNGLGGPDCDPATGTPGSGNCLFFNPFANSFAVNPATGDGNPGYVAGNENDPDLITWMNIPVGTDQLEEQFIAETVLGGATGIDFGGGGASFALGAQLRANHFSSDPLNDFTNADINPCPLIGDTSCDLPIGPLTFLGQTVPVNLDQNVYALFGEINIPVGERVVVNLAARFEDYGDPVGSSFDPKASARWHVTNWLALRGSVGTSFRAPLANQISSRRTIFAGLQAVGSGNFKAIDLVGNDQDLGPEEAFNWNVGADILLGGLRASASYWRYELDGQIAMTPAEAIANAVGNGPGDGTQLVNCDSALRPFIVFNDGDVCNAGTTASQISRVLTQWVNGPRVELDGIDLALDYERDIGPGRLALGARATHMLNYTVGDFIYRGTFFADGYEADGLANYDRDPGPVPKWRATANASYAIGPVQFGYFMRYYSGVDDNRCPDLPEPCASTEFGPINYARHVQGYTQHDLSMLWQLPVRAATVTLTGAVENVGDTAPPAARLTLGYDPSLGSALGRIWRIGVRAEY